jgi:hypothetical protein
MARGVHPFDVLVKHAADLLSARLTGGVKTSRWSNGFGTRAPGGAGANERRRRAMIGRKLDMSCRVAGCKSRSGGPGKGYMCEAHQRLPKRDQIAAREAWKAQHA